MRGLPASELALWQGHGKIRLAFELDVVMGAHTEFPSELRLNHRWAERVCHRVPKASDTTVLSLCSSCSPLCLQVHAHQWITQKID